VTRNKTATLCDNMNHRRPDARVAHCPQCGGLLNEALRVASCSEADHAAARRRQIEFCVDCGTQLIVMR
jgi:hypothetical protein